MSDYRKQAETASRRAAEIGKDVVTSNAWSYPIRGIYYTLAHKSILDIIKAQLVPRLMLAAAVTVTLFSTVYVPQAMLMTVFTFNPIGFLSAVPLVLSEANLLTDIIAAFIIEDKSDLIFDTVLLEHGHRDLISRGREISASDSRGKAGLSAMRAKMTSPLQRISPEALFRYLITIPLNLIPVVGSMVFLIINGRRAGPRFLARYFQLKQYTEQAKKQQAEQRTGALTSFGVTTVLLNLIPMGNQVFKFSNIVGAALLASDMERKGQ
ncbi:hypothetical protein PYCC9005_001936 [Savitreella phatthalungensis]